ncbi:MAG: SIS domain-containing protein [Verrucomicrobia bacterium]|nr:SIS domain-containing protein [Verrucomicrobiota bacterium]
MTKWIADYVSAQKAALDSIPHAQVESAILSLKKAWMEDRQVFIAGNGGSASNASHFITDLGKGASDKLRKRFRCLSLTDNVSWITALGNDYSYEDVFVGQLQNFARQGDVFIGVSVSGNSPNLVKAMEWSRKNGVETIALVGAKRGRMAELGHQTIVIDSTHYGRVEDAQMGILHMFCYAFMENPALVQ